TIAGWWGMSLTCRCTSWGPASTRRRKRNRRFGLTRIFQELATAVSPRRVAQRLPGRESDLLGLLLHPQRNRLGALVDRHRHDYPPGGRVASLVFRRAVDGVRSDAAVVAGRPPVQLELAEGGRAVLVGMLFPVRIGDVKPIGGFIVLALQGLKEFFDGMFLRPVAEEPPESESGEYYHGNGADDPPAPLRRPRIVFFCVHQCHEKFFLTVCV